MRLTMRTLLAWIDGVLAEPQKVELDAKVEASPVAPRLVARIRDVVARPTLTAPRVDGRGLAEDPNTVAEFLDNTLPADRLEAFERVCLESDIHLAEAADCHGLLAELAREPGLISPLEKRVRQRLRARLQQALEAPPVDESHAEAAALVRAVTEAVGRDRRVGASAPRRPESLPDRRRTKKSSWAAWLSAAVALLLLVSLAGLLGWSLLSRAKTPRAVAVAGSAKPVPAAGGGEAAANPPPEPQAVVAAPAPQPIEEPAAAAAEPGEPSPPATEDAPAPEPAAAIAAVPLPPMELADDEPRDEPVSDEPFPEEPEEPAAPPAAAPPPGIVAEGGAILRLVREGDAARWEPLTAGSPLAAAEELLVPIHAYPRLIRGDVSIRLHPGTQAALTTDADGTPRLEVVFGRAVSWTEAAEAMLGITAGGLSGVVSLGAKQEVGIDVELTRTPGDDPAVTAPGRRVTLRTVGGIGWRQTELDGGPPGQPLAGLAIEQPLPPRGGLSWNSADPAAAVLDPAAGTPDWMTRSGPVSRLDRSAATALAAALAAERPVEESLRTLATDRRVENRMAAAATLALLGDYVALVGLLCEERPGEKLSDGQWEQFEAATVPGALARGANAAARLRQAFAARGPVGRGDDIFTLVRGLSAEEQAASGAALVDLLADPALVVRRYAFRELSRVAPDDPAGQLDYRPDRSATLNERGVDWWRRKVMAESGPPP